MEWILEVLTSTEAGATSTCVKSSGLVESRLDAAFTMGLDASSWKSVR